MGEKVLGLMVAAASALLAAGVHVYLSFHHYKVKLSISTEDSICNVGQFDCDAVSASSYSEVFGIPLAVFGLVTNFVLFLIILSPLFGAPEKSERSKRHAFYLSSFIAIVSVVMASISGLLLNNFCLFCISAYLLSFISFAGMAFSLNEPVFSNIGSDIQSLFGSHKYTLGGILAIPFIAYISHQSFLQNFNAQDLPNMIQSSVAAWRTNPKFALETEPSLVKGPSRTEATLVISEFADFRCSHCRRMSRVLNTFFKANQDVRVEFYSFPLDGACNEAIPQANGISCRLAKAAYCGGKQDLGWQLHDHLFEKQGFFAASQSVEEVNTRLSAVMTELNSDYKTLEKCMDSESTHLAIQAQAKLGKDVNVQGTPTVYANGRKLPGAQLLSVLNEVDKLLKAVKPE